MGTFLKESYKRIQQEIWFPLFIHCMELAEQHLDYLIQYSVTDLPENIINTLIERHLVKQQTVKN